MQLPKSASKISIAVIMLTMTIISANLNWGKTHWKAILEADGKGYYAYLPAVFIYQDLNFGFFEIIEKEKYYSEHLYYDYRAAAEGKVINKYFCGTALAELPFFLTAHAFSNWLDYDTDGYSKLYPISVNIAALFYLLAGLIALNILMVAYNFTEKVRSVTLFATVFGTHLFYYTVGEPSMSHVYSFAFITMFLAFSKHYFLNLNTNLIYVLSILLAVIILIRPVNGLIIFSWPFISGSYSALKNGLSTALKDGSTIFKSALILLAVVSIQLIIYKLSTGHYFVYSYTDEGFRFLSPHMINILFSYKKGLFLYTPLLMLSLSGIYFLWKSSKFEFYTWLGFFLLITYVFSSWWMWYYGGSFSSRVYVEYIGFFMLLVALTLNYTKKLLFKRIYFTLIFLFICLCQIQTYQYRYYQIHWSDMNKEKYWEVFLRVDK